MMKRIKMSAKNIYKVFGRVVGVLPFCFFTLLPLNAQTVSSPDGLYSVSIDGMTYSVTFNNKVIVEKSQLGVDIDNRLFESALAVPRGEHENWCGDLVPMTRASPCATTSPRPPTASSCISRASRPSLPCPPVPRLGMRSGRKAPTAREV